MAKEIKFNSNDIQQPKVDLKNTTIVTSEDGNLVFGEGIILRKVSKFLIGSDEDGLVPLPVVYDIKTGKILIETLPHELRAEYKEFYESNK